MYSIIIRSNTACNVISGDASNPSVVAIVVPFILVTVLLAICILVVVLIILRRKRYGKQKSKFSKNYIKFIKLFDI